MSAAPLSSVIAPHTLTIEYTDAQGQVQRTEQLQGSHFTLRVQADALAILSAQTAHAAAPNEANADAAHEQTVGVSQVAGIARWQRIPPWTWALILFGCFALLNAVQLWVEHNPDNVAQNLVTLALGVTAAIALWAAFWALLGKIFAKHALYWQHICLVLMSGILLSLLVAAMHFLSFSLSWRVLGRMDNISSVAALALLIWAHLRLILPAQRKRALRFGMIAFTLASIALIMWTNHRKLDTVLDTLHTPHLYRPALQLSSAQASQSFFEQAKSLEATLKTKAGEFEPGEDGLGDDE